MLKRAAPRYWRLNKTQGIRIQGNKVHWEDAANHLNRDQQTIRDFVENGPVDGAIARKTRKHILREVYAHLGSEAPSKTRFELRAERIADVYSKWAENERKRTPKDCAHCRKTAPTSHFARRDHGGAPEESGALPKLARHCQVLLAYSGGRIEGCRTCGQLYRSWSERCTNGMHSLEDWYVQKIGLAEAKEFTLKWFKEYGGWLQVGP